MLSTAEHVIAGPDPLAVAALVVSVLALLATGINSLVNWRNRADANRHDFVLVGAMERVPWSTEPPFELTRVWKLFSASGRTITNPQIEVTGDEPWPTMHFVGSGILAPNAMLQVVPVGDYPAPDPVFWRDRAVTVKWQGSGGRTREARASISYSYI